MSVPLQKCVCWSWVSEGRSVLRRGAALLLDLVVDRRLHLGEQLLGLLELRAMRAGPLLLELPGVVALPVLLERLDLLVDLRDELLDRLGLLLQDVPLGVDLIVVHSEPSHGPSFVVRPLVGWSSDQPSGRPLCNIDDRMWRPEECRWGAL